MDVYEWWIVNDVEVGTRVVYVYQLYKHFQERNEVYHKKPLRTVGPAPSI
jgi:hypothetical protein